MKTRLCTLMLAALLLPSACSKEQGTSTEQMIAAPASTSEAIKQVQQTFAEAPASVQTNAVNATTAIQARDYEQAIVLLHHLGTRQDLTYEQGLAARNTMVTLQKDLIRAMEAGDTNAHKAFERLRELHRN